MSRRIAQVVGFIDDEAAGFSAVAFADDELEPTWTVEIQRGHSFDVQDVALGMATYCLVVDGRAAYGSVERWYLKDRLPILELTDAAAADLGIPRHIEIGLEPTAGNVVQLATAAAICPARLICRCCCSVGCVNTIRLVASTTIAGGGGDRHRIAADRSVLLWIAATRRQLDRWEMRLALLVSALRDQERPGQTVWEAETERHLALVAAHNLIKAVAAHPSVHLATRLQQDLSVLRHVNEHWEEHRSPLSRHPVNPEDLSRAGKAFYDRYPGAFPFGSGGFSSEVGPLLGPELSSHVLRTELDRIQREVTGGVPEFADLMPLGGDEEVWFRDDRGRWWPPPT